MTNKHAATSFANGLENLISWLQLISIKYEGGIFTMEDALSANRQATEIAKKLAEFSEDVMETVNGQNIDLFRNKYGDI